MTAHLYVVLRLRMRGVIPLLSQYAFMAWCISTGATFLFIFTFYSLRKLTFLMLIMRWKVNIDINLR
jgi:hypothetical protein